MTRRLTLLALGLSPLALAAAQSAEPKIAERRPADSAIEPSAVEPNLEAGGADDAFRVTIDGATPKDAIPAPADLQRATDVALSDAKLEVQATNLQAVPILSVVTATPVTAPGETVTFHSFTNYAAFIDRAELRVFAGNMSVESEPLATMPVAFGTPALWKAPAAPMGLRVVLRVYDKDGRFDETAPQDFAVVTAPPFDKPAPRTGPVFDNQRVKSNITVYGGEVTVSGTVATLGSRVTAFGMTVPVDPTGRFIAQQIVPKGTQEVAVAITAPGGDKPREYRRALTLPRNDDFLVGIVDVTAGHRSMDANQIALQGVDHADARRDFVDGRLAFYWKTRVAPEWKITAAADTGEHPLEDLFDDFLKKDARAFLRRLDPDQHYPVYGDDSTLVQDAPTYGRFYLRAENQNAEGMWGNFRTELTGTDLMRYSRALYGGSLRWRGTASTDAGERTSQLNMFAADPGTVDAREEFVSTGGSVYYFRNQDIAQGSERLFMEVRDRDSGIVLERQELIAARDYDVNYIQGRVLLRSPLPIVASSDGLFVHNSSLAGNPVWLVSTYEYTPGLTRPDAMTYGGRGQQWIGEHVRVGITGYRQGEEQSRQTLYGGDIMLRYKPGTWIRGELAHSTGTGTGASFSSTGGYDFTQVSSTGTGADAFVVEGAASLIDLGVGNGQATGYYRRRGAGYSGPGELTFGEAIDQYGGTATIGLGKIAQFKAKADITDGSITSRKALEAGLTHDLGQGFYGSVGVRADDQGSGQATAYTPFSAPNYLQGARTDAAVTLGYHHVPAADKPQQGEAPVPDQRAWSAAVFAQKTLDRDAGRLANDRVGVTGDIAVTQRLKVGGELSDGDQGFGANVKADYATGERGSLYLAYQLAAENPDAFNTGRLGRLTGGTKYRFGSSTNVFAEERYEHGAGPTGFTQAYGVDFEPWQGWSMGGRYENGKLGDALGGSIKRNVIGGNIGYTVKTVRFSTALEYRREQSDSLGRRETWASRNLATWQVTPALRLFGKANFSFSDGPSDTSLLNADYHEYSFAAAYRPVTNDRLNVLAKFTILADLPSPAQVTAYSLPIDYAQRSHIAALDFTYQLTPRLAVGAKIAYRNGELRLSRDRSAPWFESSATFWALRADYEVVRRWDLLAEVRQLSVSTTEDRRLGALVGIYRHLGRNVKAGVGFNFTDYSDDLSDLNYHQRGWFFNVIGKF